MKADELRALAERVMGLTGPSKAANLAIWEASDPQAFNKAYHDARFMLSRDMAEGEKRKAALTRMRPPTFTASLDAAMTLVPEGKEWSWDVASEGRATVTCHTENALHWETATAATPALALTAAALLARAEQQ